MAGTATSCTFFFFTVPRTYPMPISTQVSNGVPLMGSDYHRETPTIAMSNKNITTCAPTLKCARLVLLLVSFHIHPSVPKKVNRLLDRILQFVLDKRIQMVSVILHVLPIWHPLPLLSNIITAAYSTFYVSHL